jgi:hypothetical protein
MITLKLLDPYLVPGAKLRWTQGVQMHPPKYSKTVDLVKISPYMHPYNQSLCIHKLDAPLSNLL